MKEEFIFWRLAYFFISEQGYRIIQLFEDQKELWLEKLENKNAPVIRMLQHGFDWSNLMQRDIEFAEANAERVRRQINRRELHLINIYVSPFPPVDDYNYLLKKPMEYLDDEKIRILSILFAKGEYDNSFQQISALMNHEVIFPIEDEYSAEQVEVIKKSALDHANKRFRAEQELLMNGKPFITYILMFIQVVVFFILEINGGSTNTSTLIKYGAKVNQLIIDGQWWRFLTPIFLHIGFLHLVMNTIALYFLGTAVERMYGNARFLFIYLFAGFTGFIASFLFSDNLSAGASGAIFGCFGALLYFGAINPKLFFRTMGINVFMILGLNLLFGFSSSGIDNAGHLGGLAGGFLAAGIVHFPKKKRLVLQIIFLITSVAIVWGSLYYGYKTEADGQNEKFTIMMAQEYLNQNDYDKAYNLLSSFEKKSKHPSERTYLILAFVEYKKEMFAEAKLHLKKAIVLKPKMSEAYYYLAIINLTENDLQQAKENANKAVKLKPADKDYYHLVQEINRYLKSSRTGK
jgi:rhomboid protease GluP